MATPVRPAFIANIRDGLQPIEDGGFPDMGGMGSPVAGRKD